MHRPTAITASPAAVRGAASSRGRGPLVTAVVVVAISLMMVTSGCSLFGHKSNAQLLAQAASYTRCMRANGLPTFPEPTLTNGSVNLYTPASVERSSSYPAAAKACKSRLPG